MLARKFDGHVDVASDLLGLLRLCARHIDSVVAAGQLDGGLDPVTDVRITTHRATDMTTR